jgi:hypothetical protein
MLAKLLRRRAAAPDEARLAEHRERGEPWIAAIRREHRHAEQKWYAAQRERGAELSRFRGRVLETPSGRRLLEQPDDITVSVLVAAAELADWGTRTELAQALARRRLAVPSEDVRLLFALAADKRDPWRRLAAYRVALAVVDRLKAEGELDAVEDDVRRAMAVAERTRMDGYDAERTQLLARFRCVLEAGTKTRIDPKLVLGDDDWGRRVLSLLPEYGDAAGLLLHLSQATTGPTPSKKWTERARALVADTQRGEELVRRMLAEAVATRDGTRRAWGVDVYQYVTDPNAVVIRGAVWAAGAVGASWAPQLLADLAAHAAAGFEGGYEPRSIKVANACVRQLGELGTDDAVAELTTLRGRIKHKTIAKQVERALEDAAGAVGISKSQLLERQVPTFDLDSAGRRDVVVGGARAVFHHDDLTWITPAGKPAKTVPKTVKEGHAAELRALRAEAKEIRKALAAQRLRVETLFTEDRVWDVEEWRALYLEHPLVGAVSGRLIWRFGDTSALPVDGAFVTADGTPVEPAGDVRLWHPIDASADEVSAWRALLLERRIAQPFKQAFREVYVLAPAERETRTYSNRFAAHILKYRQAYALIKSRGWSVTALGPYDNDGGRQWRDFDVHGIRVEFWMEHADEDFEEMDMIASLATTDQVRFSRRGDDDPMPLEDVPPIVFSEAMRDVDLFVGVASIAADPTWEDRGGDRFYRYWESASFGELGETAKTRRDVLRDLVPQLRIADRCEVTGKFLVVRGDLRTYKIHLGSANVLMEPNDEYLCIVPARGKAALGNVFLPFEDDQRLSVILSKAFLLAEDKKISDRTITDQIKGR